MCVCVRVKNISPFDSHNMYTHDETLQKDGDLYNPLTKTHDWCVSVTKFTDVYNIVNLEYYEVCSVCWNVESWSYKRSKKIFFQNNVR